MLTTLEPSECGKLASQEGGHDLSIAKISQLEYSHYYTNATVTILKATASPHDTLDMSPKRF